MVNNGINKGDTIGIIAPSGAISNVEKLDATKDYLNFHGYEVRIFPCCYKNWQGFAGSDNERVQDLHEAFSDKEIKAIICARGGYGILRILDKIDYDVIKNNPKIFAGSSDVTLLLAAFYAKCGLETFHSQMALNIAENDILEDFTSAVNGKKTKITPKANFLTLQSGETEGILWGGNLATLVSLFGSNSNDYLPKDDIVLFLEDINEPVYKIDRMLTQILRHKELKNKIKGIVFGEFTGADENALVELLKEFSQKFAVPNFYGYNISHGPNNTTLPFGRSVKLMATGEILFL